MANGHGGKRAGAGRPKKVTCHLAEPDGLMPVDYMMATMRDEDKKQHERMDAAKAAAPYLYPKLTAVALTAEGEVELIHKMEIEIVSPENQDG